MDGGGALILGRLRLALRRVTGMPFLTNASAVTAPTGPAPTTITRSSCCMTNSELPHYTHQLVRDGQVSRAALQACVPAARRSGHA
jgi:hypothetical protein